MSAPHTRKCIGFGEHDGRCENEAGSRWSDYWCERCDKLRLAHISRRLEGLPTKCTDPHAIARQGTE